MPPFEALEHDGATDDVPGRSTDEDLARNGLRLQSRCKMYDVADRFSLGHSHRAGADADPHLDVEATQRRTNRYGGIDGLCAAIFLSHGKAKVSQDAIA